MLGSFGFVVEADISKAVYKAEVLVNIRLKIDRSLSYTPGIKDAGST